MRNILKTSTRRQFCGAIAAAPFAHAAAPGRRQPNVIVLLTDDQGYGDLACHGNPVVHSPNFDRLHSESVRFTNFHVDPLCSPTRSALMTGRYSCRTGVWSTVYGRELLRRDEVTMADVFAANGYRTAIRGKWHLGDNYPYRPQDRGFQDVLIHGGGGVGQTPDYWGNSYFNDTYFRNGKPEKFEGYCTDVWVRDGVRFIERNRDHPFFLYLPTNAAHAPLNVDPKYAKPYLDAGVPEDVAKFYGMVTNIDENVGYLRASLKRLGLEKDTLFVYMGDNGSAAGARPRAGEAQYHPFNAGMRGQKGSPYDGGHRVTCFMHWPGAGIQGGRDLPQLAAHIDLLPTFIDLLGLKRPAGPEFDGVALGPVLKGGGAIKPRSIAVQTQQRDTPQKWARSAMLDARWRLVEGKELYDIVADPGQTKDVAPGHHDVVSRLRGDYEKWWSSVSQRFGEYSEIVLGSERENPSRLNCMDWHCEKIMPWNQPMVEKNQVGNGFWAVRAERAGRYEFTLRERPVEAKGIMQSRQARIRIGKADEHKPIPQGAAAVSFMLMLPAGSARLETWLEGWPDGASRGAYFVDVRFLG